MDQADVIIFDQHPSQLPLPVCSSWFQVRRFRTKAALCHPENVTNVTFIHRGVA